jgi:dual specificity protein kinase YAK1
MENGKQVHEFFNKEPLNPEPYGRGGHVFRLKSMEQYSKEHNTTEQPSKQYFKATTLPEIIKGYAFAKKGAKQSDIDKGQCFALRSLSPLW